MAVLDLDAEQIDGSVDVESILRLLGVTLANMPEWPAIQWPTLKPGTYLGDVLTVWNRASDDSAVDAALERLLTKPYTFRSGGRHYVFSRGCVFNPERWVALQSSVEGFRREQGLDGPQQVWIALARGPLLVAIRELPASTPMGDAYGSIRRRLRREVERFLLDGKTLDRRAEEPWPEDSPEALAMEATLAHDLGDWLDLRLDLMWAIGLLTRNEREALLAPLARTPDAMLAKRDGVGEGAIRKRRSAARRKLSEFLAMR